VHSRQTSPMLLPILISASQGHFFTKNIFRLSFYTRPAIVCLSNIATFTHAGLAYWLFYVCPVCPMYILYLNMNHACYCVDCSRIILFSAIFVKNLCLSGLYRREVSDGNNRRHDEIIKCDKHRPAAISGK